MGLGGSDELFWIVQWTSALSHDRKVTGSNLSLTQDSVPPVSSNWDIKGPGGIIAGDQTTLAAHVGSSSGEFSPKGT